MQQAAAVRRTVDRFGPGRLESSRCDLRAKADAATSERLNADGQQIIPLRDVTVREQAAGGQRFGMAG